MEEQTTTAAMTRLFVGGLGDKVTEDDIKKTFSNLGFVTSVDFIKTKGRSFAYINFLPSSHNSLSKLFSTYNGCSWKGGKLKLEKAKEHYTDRLKREWAEEAELKNSEHISQSEVNVSITDSLEPESTLDLKDMQLRLYFPKLQKVKPLPLSGTGKHKYSFRRLEGPPCPVHFCDCPEHAVPVQTRAVHRANSSGIRKGGINRKEYNITKSVMNPSVSCEKDHKEDKIHDSVIQDCGVNDEEISMMDSVMKKLLDKGASKNNKKNLHTSQEKTVVVTSEIQEEANLTDDADDGTYDDDIQINTVAGQNFTSFSSRNLEQRQHSSHEEGNYINDETNDMDDETDEEEEEEEEDDDDIQINAVGGRKKRQTSLANEMAKLNERQNHDDSAHGIKPGFLGPNVDSLRKRKSVSIEANSDNLASSIHEKLEEHTTVNTQPEPKRLITNDMWSQKSAWKQLVGDSSSRSFTLSQITPADDAIHEKKPKLRKKAPLNIKKGKKTVRFALETPIDNKEHEEFNNFEPKEPKPADETPIGKEEDDVVNNSIQVGQSTEQGDKEEPPVVDPARGSSWLQRSSWTQLVGGGNDSSFSISQILPADVLQRQKSGKPDEFGTFSTVSIGSFFKEPKISETGTVGFRGSENDAKGASGPTDVGAANSSDLEPKKTSVIPRRGVEISENCPFMRNADSVKEWSTARAATSNSLKKKKTK